MIVDGRDLLLCEIRELAIATAKLVLQHTAQIDDPEFPSYATEYREVRRALECLEKTAIDFPPQV